MNTPTYINSEAYQKALRQEANKWGREAELAAQNGIPFCADFRRAERIMVDRGDDLPQLQSYDPQAELIMNGHVYQWIFDIVNSISKSAKVLVPACGMGGLCLELARLGHHVHGIDISEKAIKFAKRFAEENPFTSSFGSVSYTIADLNQIKLPANSYDVVIAWNALHHILYLDRLMKELQKALRVNGLLICFDKIHNNILNRIVGGFLYFILPTHVSYRNKFRWALLGHKKLMATVRQHSPFEEISTERILESTKNSFHIVSASFHSSIAYRDAICGDLKVPLKLKYSFLRMLKKVDDFAIKYRLLKGDHIFMIAIPRPD